MTFSVDLTAEQYQRFLALDGAQVLAALQSGRDDVEQIKYEDVGSRVSFRVAVSRGPQWAFQTAETVRQQLIKLVGGQDEHAAKREAEIERALGKYHDLVGWMLGMVSALEPEIATSADAGDPRAREMRAEMCWHLSEAYSLFRLDGHSDADARELTTLIADKIVRGR